MSLTLSSLLEIMKALQVSDTRLVELEQRYLSTSIRSVRELIDLVLAIGKVEKKVSLAEDIVFGLEERINIVKHKLKFIKDEVKPRVLCLTGVHPFTIEINPYLSEIIQIAGAKPFDFTEEEDVLNPDMLLIISDKMERLFGDLAALLSLDKWKNIDAVKKNAVFLLDGSEHFRGFSLQVAEEIEILAEIFYPKQLTFGGNGETWIQFGT